MKTSTSEKEEQDKITWQLQEEVERLKNEVHDISIARGIAEKERDTLQKQSISAEDFAKDAMMKYERSKRVSIDLSREIDLIKDKFAVLEEKNAQLERYKEKYQRVSRELQKELDFAQQRRIVAAEEKLQAELERKRIRRIVLDEQEGAHIAQDTLEKLDSQLAQVRNELGLKRAQLVQEEREYGTLGQDFADTQTNLNQQIKQDLGEPEKLRLGKQSEGYKNQIAEEKARVNHIRLATRDLENEIEHHRFDVKTLHSDINKTRLETKRTRKVVEELKSLLDKQESEEEIFVSDTESDEEKDRKRKGTNKRNMNRGDRKKGSSKPNRY